MVRKSMELRFAELDETAQGQTKSLSMKLERALADKAPLVPPRAANREEDEEDLWDNVPV